MARPTKKGLDYFPFDVDFFNDEKIEAISGEFGIKGEIVAIKLLTAVYRNGYFIEWSEMLQMKMLKSLPSISKVLLEQILSRLVRWDFFDENLFNSAKVLTSKGIQKRYFEATKRCKPSDSLPYLLVNVTKTPVNVAETQVNVTETTQRKVKESKGNNNVLLEKEPKEREYTGEENFSEEENSDPKQTVETSKKSSAKKRFQIPTPEEVQKYCDERQNGITGKEFCDFYQSKDWMVGKNKMVDWEAAVRTWENKRKTQQQKRNNGNNNTKQTTPNSTGKISARSFLAKKLAGQTARDNQSRNITIEAEIIK